MDIKRINPNQRWSDATVFNKTVYFVEVPSDTSGDMQQQVDQLLQQAEATLTLVGTDKSRLLSATIYITDIKNLSVLNLAWDAWLPARVAPSRACVKVELIDPAMLVEVAFVAALPEF